MPRRAARRPARAAAARARGHERGHAGASPRRSCSSPLQQRLRDQSVENLRDRRAGRAPDFALREARDQAAAHARSTGELPARRASGGRVELRRPDRGRRACWSPTPRSRRADGSTPPGFLADTDFAADAAPSALLRRRCGRCAAGRTVDRHRRRRRCRSAMPLFDGDGTSAAWSSPQRRLTEVATAVEQVRNALLAAAGDRPAGRRRARRSRSPARCCAASARLRAAALRITRRGPGRPDAARPRPRRGRRPRPRAGAHAGGAAPPGGRAALVRRRPPRTSCARR